MRSVSPASRPYERRFMATIVASGAWRDPVPISPALSLRIAVRVPTRLAAPCAVSLLLAAARCGRSPAAHDSVPGGKVVTPDAGDGHRRRCPSPLDAVGNAGRRQRRSSHSAGCGACHTFTPAARRRARSGPTSTSCRRSTPAEPGGPLEEFIYELDRRPRPRPRRPGYPTTSCPRPSRQSLPAKQLADLVAFLAKGP